MGEIVVPEERPQPVPRHEVVFALVEQQVDHDQPSEARSIEDGADDEWIIDQEYSHSTRMLAIVGELAVKGALETTETGRIAKETLRERFESSVIEMLHTDKQFREHLEINRERKHIVRAGKVMALDGQTGMVGICRRGAKKASLEAAKDERMQVVAERCAADARVAQRVEQLPVGGVLIGCSMDPKEAMARHGKKFYEDLGFREGLAFLQWYYRLDERTLLAATYSVDQSDIETMREVWTEFGGEIPASEVTNSWLDHDIQRQCTEAEARQLVNRIRDRFYQKRGAATRRYSVDEFMAINQHVCDEMFESIYLNVARAHETGKLDDSLRTFVEGLLHGSQHLNPKIQKQLLAMQWGGKVSQIDVALLEQLVRYAVTEHLRAGLALLGARQLPQVQGFMAAAGNPMYEAGIAAILAGNVLNGARAGRTYGGCTRSIDPGDNSEGYGRDTERPQDAFGGQDQGEAKSLWKWTRGLCRTPNCPTRPNTTLVGPCSVCWGCQKKFDRGEDPIHVYAQRSSN